MFQRKQHELDSTNSTTRTHFIPPWVYEFAQSEVSPSKYAPEQRKNRPTLADVFYGLVQEGINLIDSEKPTFREVGRPDDFISIRIKVEKGEGEMNEALSSIVSRVEAGEFELEDSFDIKGRKKDGLSLISAAVCLMELAVKHRVKNQ